MITVIQSLINKFRNKKTDPIILDRMSSGLLYNCVVCNTEMISNSKINYLSCAKCKIAFKNRSTESMYSCVKCNASSTSNSKSNYLSCRNCKLLLATKNKISSI